jgi:hypothetical protein
MPKKQILTDAEIKKDLICALKHPPAESERSVNTASWVVLGIFIASIVVIYFYHLFLLWLLLGTALYSIGFVIFKHQKLKMQIKKISLADHEITTETVSHTECESYVIRGTRHRRYTIYRYILHFESKKSFVIPKDNYLWSTETPMSDVVVFNTTHRGDTMTVVTKKDTGEIVVAYNNNLFEYKN